MAGYSQMNQGYGEQPGVNWGKVAAYTGGGIMAAGVMRMGAHKLNSSTMGGRSKAMRGIKSGASWAKGHGRTGLDRGKSLAKKGYNEVGGWKGMRDGAKKVAGFGQMKTYARHAKQGTSRILNMPDGPQRDMIAGVYGHRSKEMLKDYYGARDFKGGKRVAAGVARYAGTMGALGLAGSAAINTLDFLNPFGFGSIDD